MLTKKISVVFAMLTAMLAMMQPAAAMFPATALPIASLAIEAEASGTYFDRCDSGYQSIVDALESIGVDSSYSYRKKIAKANGISNYTGKSSQNIKLLKLLKKGELVKPGAGGSSGNESVNYATGGGEAVYNEASSHLDKKYGRFDGLGFHWRAWCADFVSWCASNAGQSDAIPWNASVSGLRSAIKNAGGTEYSKSQVKNGESSFSRATVQAMSESSITPVMEGSTISMETILHTEKGIIPVYIIPIAPSPRKHSLAY